MHKQTKARPKNSTFRSQKHLWGNKLNISTIWKKCIYLLILYILYIIIYRQDGMYFILRIKSQIKNYASINKENIRC